MSRDSLREVLPEAAHVRHETRTRTHARTHARMCARVRRGQTQQPLPSLSLAAAAATPPPPPPIGAADLHAAGGVDLQEERRGVNQAPPAAGGGCTSPRRRRGGGGGGGGARARAAGAHGVASVRFGQLGRRQLRGQAASSSRNHTGCVPLLHGCRLCYSSAADLYDALLLTCMTRSC